MSLLDALIEDDLWLPSPIVGTEGPPDTRIAHREIWICRRTDGGAASLFGTGTLDDPFDGSTSAKFDDIMRSKIPENCTIRLGPGVFETQGGPGNGHVFDGFEVKNGWKIVGSGMFQTTVKLVNVQAEEAGISVVVFSASAALTRFEISDLTVDCNLQGQPTTSGHDYPRIMVAGVEVGGVNLVARRIRVINWGTQTPLFEYGVANPRSLECFPLIFDGRGLSGTGTNIIEDCMVEHGNTNNARETTCINNPGGLVTRKCLVSGEQVVIDGGQEVTVRNRGLVITNVAYSSPSAGVHICTVEFAEKHYKQQNDPNASMMTPNSYVLIGGIEITVGGVATGNNPFNGYFPVVEVVTDKILKYKMASAPPAGYSIAPLVGAFMGAQFQAYAIGGDRGVFERNRALGCFVGGPYQDTVSSDCIIIRNNYYRDVHFGPYANDSSLNRCVVEDNIIDLNIHPLGNVNGPPPYGISFGSTSGSEVRYDEVIVRGNIIRHTDDQVDSNWAMNSIGVAVDRAGSVIIEDNVVTLEQRSVIGGAPEIGLRHCGKASGFNNQDAQGKLISPYDRTNLRFVYGLEDDVDDAILMYLMKR